MTDLTPHLRQYRHNDGSEEFVFGYDHDGINRLVAGLDAEIERLNSALKKQAAAAKSGMNAAKQVSSYQLEEAKRLRAESSPEALESERAANARMTDEIERLQAEIERLRADFADARSCAKALEQEMNRARADEHQAMHYLEQIRKAVAPDVDFPTLVRMCGEIQQERDQLKAVIAQCHEAMCAVSQAAYDNAFPVCCGYAGAECCGLPDPDWSEHDKLIMDTLDGPINAVANQLRAKASEA